MTTQLSEKERGKEERSLNHLTSGQFLSFRFSQPWRLFTEAHRVGTRTGSSTQQRGHELFEYDDNSKQSEKGDKLKSLRLVVLSFPPYVIFEFASQGCALIGNKRLYKKFH